MKRVYLAQDYMEAERLRDYLLTQNIPVHISDEHTHSLQAVNPMAFPALWVEDDYDSDYVRGKIRGFLSRQQEEQQAGPWSCNGCGENNPGSFESCWHCGQDRPGE